MAPRAVTGCTVRYRASLPCRARLIWTPACKLQLPRPCVHGMLLPSASARRVKLRPLRAWRCLSPALPVWSARTPCTSPPRLRQHAPVLQGRDAQGLLAEQVPPERCACLNAIRPCLSLACRKWRRRGRCNRSQLEVACLATHRTRSAGFAGRAVRPARLPCRSAGCAAQQQDNKGSNKAAPLPLAAAAPQRPSASGRGLRVPPRKVHAAVAC